MEPKIVCYDLEIRLPISDFPDGWEAAKRGECGVSALVLSDNLTGRFHIYDQHTLIDGIDHMNAADLLVSFNGIDFDSQVLYGASDIPISAPQYDILKEVWRQLPQRQKGFKLGEICERTLGIGKSGNGEFAPALVRQKRFGQLFDYCLNDVHLTRTLFNHIVDGGAIKTPEGHDLQLREPPFKDFA